MKDIYGMGPCSDERVWIGWETVFRTLLLELSYEMSYADDRWLGDGFCEM
jgi:hypothetical protein